ncbi:glycosyltransferase [Psychroflexus salinarum]|uniref:Glycosyltransferase n=1 Tax=Psychroflexus salinarum TaxID=546024 RepID=A0ABW3GS38_9FLAO
MKAVFLIIDYVPHQVLSIKTLIERNSAEILAFHVGRFNISTPKHLPDFSTSLYTEKPKDQILSDIIHFNPDVVVTAGWMIPEYNWLCKRLKKSSTIPIVAMTDTPWYGSVKQKINVHLSLFYIKSAFTHLWVAGIRQYDYARKLGFTNNQIIFNSLSADTRIFHQVDIMSKVVNYPKNFLYIGRYTEVKGLRNLMNAWSSIKDKKGWTFTLIGEGEMKEELESTENFIVKEFMTQDRLLEEMKLTGCFVLPSLKEPWALVIHEAAAAGLPIICTETCGAAPHFVINYYNGFRIQDNSIEDLKDKLELIIHTDENVLLEYGKRSRKLSHTINPEIQMASLLQLINGN